jgi:hypothetical protein
MYANHSFACSCVPIDFDERINKADMIYKANLVSASYINPKNEDDWDYIEAKFSVIESYKGDMVQEFTVKTGLGGGDCGIPMIIARNYIIIKSSKQEYIGICDGSGILRYAQEKELKAKVEAILNKSSNKAKH